MHLIEVRPQDVALWQQRLLTSLAPKTVADSRTALAQVFDAALDHDAISVNPVRRVKAPKVEHRAGRALSVDEVRRLVAATDGYRYGAVLAILYGQGWRVSEALGLAWEDLDLETGVAHVRRAVIEVSGHGRRLAPPKTAGAEGKHILLPGVVRRLERWRQVQAEEREAAGTLWEKHRYDGRVINLVFTNTVGGLVPRQAIDKLGRRIAESIGIDPTGLGTHAGRRSVVTALYSAGETLDDVARHVGHRSTATTAGYVAALGDRPKRTAAVAAELLDDA
jgi:integrase